MISWLIANLEIVAIFILAPFIAMALKANPEMLDGLSLSSPFMRVVTVSFLVVLLGGFPSEGFVFDILALALSVGGALGVIATNCSEQLMDTHMICCGVSALVVGVAVAIYAVSNFYDTVSLRWVYSNSAATKFEVSAAYGFSRFCAGFHLGAFLYAFIVSA